MNYQYPGLFIQRYGSVQPLDTAPTGMEAIGQRMSLTRRLPIGPVLGITPFNFPLNLVAHKVAPALASGCPILIKPAPQTPLTALRLGQIVVEAGGEFGWPAGAISVLPCSNEVAAKAGGRSASPACSPSPAAPRLAGS